MPGYRTQIMNFVVGEPLLLPVLQSHLADNDGSVLATVLLAEIIDWVVTHREDEPAVGTRVLTWMNEQYEIGSPELREVIASGGVEALPNPGQPGSTLRNQLSPTLRTIGPWNIS